MEDSDMGIIIAQQGTPVAGSADYQRVYDSRRRFMELAFRREVAVDASADAAGRIIVFRHGLGFVSMFESDFKDPDLSIFMDKEVVFLRGSKSHYQGTITLRIYNFPVLEEYTTVKGLPEGFSSPRSEIGAKFLDTDNPGVDVGDNWPVGFSVDTTKKILSIHKHGFASINPRYRYSARATAIDTATDTITFSATPGADTTELRDLSWLQTAGTPIVYSSLTAMPGGMPIVDSIISATLYVIPVSSTTFKVAYSRAQALAGNAIDLTSAGSFPAYLRPQAEPGEMTDAIFHDVGYPPTFLLAQVYYDTTSNGVLTKGEPYVGPMIERIQARVAADSRYLTFHGVQSVFIAYLAYVILKDPAELAR